jgi:hypothetical protein
MDPITLAAGAAAGYFGGKLLDKKTGKKVRSTKATGTRKTKAASTAKRKTTASAGKKTNGTLKKGYRYAKGGRVVKAKG